MSKPITRYSKARNLSESDTVDKNTDNINPYTFDEWLKRHIGVSPSREFSQYNEYLRNWYNTRLSKASSKEVTKEQYKNLLRELAVVFRDDIQKNVWLTRVNFDDDWDLETIIPFFARKLKEIAMYLSGRREIIKQAKLKYNMVGAVQSLEKLFHNYLLRAFTKRQTTLGVSDLSAWSKFTELSAIREDFTLNIEELFDDQEYFDKDPSVGSSEYFDLTNTQVIDYYTTLGFPPSALGWLFQTGFANLSANHPATWTLSGELSAAGVATLDGLPVSAFETADRAVLNTYNYFDLSNQYLGERQWIALGGYYVPTTKTYPFDLVQGNNWFYWPSGEFYNEADVTSTLEPIELSATNFSLYGTAGTDYRNSDIIFVRKGTTTAGAWLSQIDTTTTQSAMSAILEPNDKTIFKFPWAGVGLSGEDIPWSGKSLSNIDKTFDYLSDDFKKAITDAYWDEVDVSHEITPILLNDTTLVDSGATAATYFVSADKITIRDSANDANLDGIFTDPQQYAWLYKFVSTQLPIVTGSNQLFWPIKRFETTTATPSAYLPTTCVDMPLSAISVSDVFSAATAGHVFGLSDSIIKLAAFGSTITEMAWLSSASTSALNSFTPGVSAGSKYDGTIQPGFTFKANAGNYASFMWSGTDNTNVNNVIRFFDHSKDCPYRVLNQNLGPLSRDVSNLNLDIGTKRWDLCTCKSFYYSPAGHSGAITDFYGIHDFIVEDFDYPTPFDIEAWRDDSGNKYNNSTKFAWYKTTANDISYETGGFVNTANGGAFLLRRGHVYRYYRTNLKRDAANFSVPYIVVGASIYGRKTPTTTNTIGPVIPKWIKATKQQDGNFYSTDDDTDMVLRPGDVLMYYHYNAEKQVDIYTWQDSAINFLLQTQLSGWNYSAHSLSATSIGAKPFWAYADDKEIETQFKGASVYGGKLKIIDEYTQYTQPAQSEIYLTNDLYFEYTRVGTSLIWTQPVEIATFVDEQQWNQLMFSTELATASGFLDQVSELSLSATNDPADILLETVSDLQPVLVNYYARSPFTFTQDLSDSTLGIPPTGGAWVEPVSSVYVKPSQPYSNLTNRHYPTVATAANMGTFYTAKESGGYLTPKYLGASVFLGRKFTTGYATTSGGPG